MSDHGVNGNHQIEFRNNSHSVNDVSRLAFGVKDGFPMRKRAELPSFGSSLKRIKSQARDTRQGLE